MFAFCSVRFASIRDCCSLVSMIMGVFGFGHGIGLDEVLVLEKMFASRFILVLGRLLLYSFIFHEKSQHSPSAAFLMDSSGMTLVGPRFLWIIIIIEVCVGFLGLDSRILFLFAGLLSAFSFLYFLLRSGMFRLGFFL